MTISVIEKSKNKGGRPPDYNVDFHPDDLIRLAEEGCTIIDCCAEWSISHQTFHRWRSEHQEFSDSYQRARPKMQRWLLRKGRENLIGSKDSNINDRMWGMLSRSVYKMPTDERFLMIEGFADAVTIEDKRLCVMNALSQAEITPTEAEKFLGLLERSLKIIESSELIARVAKLEEVHGVAQ